MVILWNWLDWVLVLIVLFSIVSGVREGFTRGLIGLASLIVGLVAAALGYRTLGDKLTPAIHSASLAYGAAFLILFVAVLIVGGLIAGFAQRLIKTVGMTWFDRFLGLFFGVLRGLLVDAVVVMAMLAFSIKANAVRASHFAPSILRGSQATASLMPPEFRGRFQSGVDNLKHTLEQAEKNARGNRSTGR